MSEPLRHALEQLQVIRYVSFANVTATDKCNGEEIFSSQDVTIYRDETTPRQDCIYLKAGEYGLILEVVIDNIVEININYYTNDCVTASITVKGEEETVEDIK